MDKVSGKVKLENSERVNRLDALLMQIKLSLLMREAKPGSEEVINLEALSQKLRSNKSEDRKVAKVEAEELLDIFSAKKVEAQQQLRTVVGKIDEFKGDKEVVELVKRVETQKTNLIEKIDSGGDKLTEKEIDDHEGALKELRSKLGIHESEEGLAIMEDTLFSVRGIIEARRRLDRPVAYKSPVIERSARFARGKVEAEDDGSRLQMRGWSWKKKRKTEKVIEDFKTKARELHIEEGGKKLRALDGDTAMDWLVQIRDRRSDLKSLAGKSREARDNALETLSLLEIEAQGAFEQRLRRDLGFDDGSVQTMALEQVVGEILSEAKGGKFARSKNKLKFAEKYEGLKGEVQDKVKKLEQVGVFPSAGYAEVGIPADPEQWMSRMKGGKEDLGKRGALMDGILRKAETKFTADLLEKLTADDGEVFAAEILEKLKENSGTGSEMSALRDFVDKVRGDDTGIAKEQARFENLMNAGQYGKASRHLKAYITKVGLRESSADFQFAIMLRDAQYRLGQANEDMGEEFEQWQHSTFIPSLKDVTPENVLEIMPKVWGTSNVDHVFGGKFANAGAMSIELEDGTRKTWSPAVMYQELQSTRASMKLLNAEVNKGDGAAYGIVLEYLFGKGARMEGDLVVDVSGNELMKLSDKLFVTDFEFSSEGLAQGKLQNGTREAVSIHEILEQSVWMNRRADKFWMYSGEVSEHIAQYPKEQLENTSKWVAAAFRMGHAYSSHFGKITGAYEQIAKSNHMLSELRVYKAGSIVKKTIQDNLMFQEIETVLGASLVDKKKATLFAKVLTERLGKKIALGGGKYMEEGGKSITVGMRSREEARLYGNNFKTVQESWSSGLGVDWLVAHGITEEIIPDVERMKVLIDKSEKGEVLGGNDANWVIQAKEFHKLCETMQWGEERNLDVGSGVMISEKELMENMRFDELEPLVKRRNMIMGDDWKPQNMAEFMSDFNFASVMDPSKFFQGSDVLEYSTKYMKAAMEVGSKLSKLQSGRATAADVIEATGMMRSYLPPEQVDAWLEAFLRIDYRASTRQVRAYEVAKTNPDDDRTILNRKIKDENGNTFWLIGHDGHRVAEKEMFRGAYNKKMWNRKIMTGRDIEVEAAAMSSEGMFPRKIMDEIVDDMIGGGKSLSSLLKLDDKSLSEKQIIRRKIVKKILARSWRTIKRIPLFDDPAWAAWSFGSEVFNLVLEAGQEVVSDK